MIKHIMVRTRRQGLHEFSAEVQQALAESGLREGLCTIFLQHTSASLIIQENADASARDDLENWLNRLVRENDPLYTHNHEGADDMPAHIKAALTQTFLSIPVSDGRLALGTWQGVYLWEHRHRGDARSVVLHFGA